MDFRLRKSQPFDCTTFVQEVLNVHVNELRLFTLTIYVKHLAKQQYEPFLKSLVMTRCQYEIRTSPLPDDGQMRYVLGHGRGLDNFFMV